MTSLLLFDSQYQQPKTEDTQLSQLKQNMILENSTYMYDNKSQQTRKRQTFTQMEKGHL